MKSTSASHKYENATDLQKRGNKLTLTGPGKPFEDAAKYRKFLGTDTTFASQGCTYDYRIRVDIRKDAAKGGILGEVGT
jgi:hypothetical protein